ncbi:MAG: 2'-5' RNA ligase family protein [Lautropia sp.]
MPLQRRRRARPVTDPSGLSIEQERSLPPEQDLLGDVPPRAPRPRPTGGSAPLPRHCWFFALRPDARDAARIHAFAGELLASRGISGSRIAPERLHVTLDLVGHDVNQAVVDAACGAADSIRLPALEVTFDTAGSFSAPSGPFVLLGSEGLDAVRALRISLGSALADWGFVPPRSYEPHMTLCYDRRRRVPRAPVAPIGFHAGEFALVKSHIGLSRHEVLRTWRLAG